MLRLRLYVYYYLAPMLLLLFHTRCGGLYRNSALQEVCSAAMTPLQVYLCRCILPHALQSLLLAVLSYADS